ncbi:MAG: VCBS domain-containing protein, partial [Desulfovibrio sp.]|nr:VCBS domain-containing protein [Desulfovibrio sp.]
MADIKLSRPAAGQRIAVSSAPDARIVLDFPADQVSIDRPEGSNSLFFNFDDGSSLELQNFYVAYNREEIPEFQVDGQVVAGAEFFQAFGPGFLPAAGPATSVGRNARYSDLSNMELTEGTWHLNEADYRLNFDGQEVDDVWTVGTNGNLSPTLSTGGAPISLGITESGWDGISSASPAPVRATGSFTVSDPDGDNLVATVAIGGKTVAVNLGGPTTVESDYGALVITPSGGGSNITFAFEYTIKEDPYSKTDQLAQGEQVTDSIVISINDGMGHTVTQPINVRITGSNDAPDITGMDDLTLKDVGVHAAGGRLVNDSNTGYKLDAAENFSTTAGGTAAGQHLGWTDGKIVAIDPDNGDTLTYGFASVTIGGQTTSLTPDTGATAQSGFDTVYNVSGYGTLHLNSANGNYRFVLDTAENSTVNKLSENTQIEISFTPAVRDLLGASDGASSTMRDGSATPGGEMVDITIIGSNEQPHFAGTPVTWANGDSTVKEDGKQVDLTVSGQVHGKDVDNDGNDLVYGLKLGNESVGTLYVIPADNPDGFSLSADTNGGNYFGVITMTPATGAYTFTLNNSAPCVQALDSDASDEGITITVPGVVQDAHGAWDTTNIDIRIDGTNDKPRVLGGSVLHLREDGEYGKEYTGSANVTADGTFTLRHGENAGTKPDSGGDAYEVHAGLHKLSAESKISITDVDKGDNEHLEWGVKLTGGGTVKVSDVSTLGAAKEGAVSVYIDGDAKVISQDDFNAKGPAFNDYYGKVTFYKDGSYEFELNNAPGSPADKLGEFKDGDANTFAQLKLSFYANDGKLDDHGDKTAGVGLLYDTNVTITIRGSNDAPTITSHKDTLSVTERGAAHPSVDIEATGSVIAHDDDNGDSKTYGLALGDNANLDGATLHSRLFVVSDGLT